MSQPAPYFAPPGTPGYTGTYEVRNVPRGDGSGLTDPVLCAQQPDGQWVAVRPYSEFETKEASDGK